MVGSLKNYTSNPNKLDVLDDAIRKELFSEENSVFPINDIEKETECLQVFYSLDALTEELVKQIKTAEEELYMASTYTEPRVVKAILNTDKNVKVRLVAQVGRIAAVKRLQAISSMGELKRLISLTNNTYRPSKDLPYSFALKDHEYVGIEIRDPQNPEEFFMGLTLKGKEVYEFFLNKFTNLYDKE
ncbi:hypothetical protein AKJ49_02170 [candidate division MSBL1 archaeon SCGC-AAA382A03]|uniref:Uncharacterized protein n=1 Tax=candidate division MSBL1 archaeon SCGC-AAA382A03 TaxID=1698278 RepID=A0A133VD69_9EURY|nr:hypothetical protein AKJ49_02170 [candidate division MSBL1 archaeon SCGC-AAA382A03]